MTSIIERLQKWWNKNMNEAWLSKCVCGCYDSEHEGFFWYNLTGCTRCSCAKYRKGSEERVA